MATKKTRKRGTLIAKRDETSGNTPDAKGSMLVRVVEAQSLSPDIPHAITYRSPFNVEALQNVLSTHPNKQFVEMILDHAKNRVPLGYEGSRKYREQLNWPSAFQHRQAIQDNILKILKNNNGDFTAKSSSAHITFTL